MDVSFYRGNDHEVKFKFPKFNGTIEKVFLTVKCLAKTKRIQKKMGDGIKFDGEYYVASFVPEDTDKLSCDLNMTYDIKIIVGGKRYTVAKHKFKLLEENTSLEDEE